LPRQADLKPARAGTGLRSRTFAFKDALAFIRPGPLEFLVIILRY
jgi:hypothetical protein